MKSVYPPRLKFRHAILDDDQLIVEEGVSALTDLSYLHGISLSSRQNELAYYVRSLVKDCARQDLGYKLKYPPRGGQTTKLDSQFGNEWADLFEETSFGLNSRLHFRK